MIIAWIVLSFIVAFIGSDRKIGYWGTFFLSLLLSPIIGAIFALASQRKTPEPEPETVQRQYLSKEGVKFYDLANREHRKGNYNEAIELLHKALNFNPNSNLVLLNLSVCYSELKNKEKGFYYLDKAVANGYTNFKFIQEQNNLKYLKEQPEFQEFVENGYKLSQKQISVEPVTDSISKLEKLAQLKEKGILTEDEFQKEKEKILMAK